MEIFRTKRLSARCWREDDLPLAEKLWGNSEVMALIDVRGGLNREQISAKLKFEIDTFEKTGTQYWPVFETVSGDFAGCCGLKPWLHSQRTGPELGFHLIPEKWGRGYAFEAASGVIEFARNKALAPRILSGHHPDHHRSKQILERLGFMFLEKVFFPPTGLMHLSYELKLQ